MHFEVFLTEDAHHDLVAILEYIASHDAPQSAARVVGGIESALESLATFPARGAHPRELLNLGIREYRQIYFKPYRIFYRISGKQVFVYLIADGRRDMQTVLADRLLRPR